MMASWTREFKRPRFSLHAVAVGTADGLFVTLIGGDRPHLGSVVLAEPRPSLAEAWRYSATSSVLNRLGHREEEICRPLAEELALALAVPVVVAGGVHLDLGRGSLGPELRDEVLAEVRALGDEIITAWRSEK